jgi:hypothetical protein
MAFMIVWWQPIWPPVSSKFLFYSKLAGLGSVALILVMRASEQIELGRQCKYIPAVSPLDSSFLENLTLGG